MKWIEKYCTLARRIKYIEGKFRKSGTTFVTQQQTYNSKLYIADKISLEEVIIEEKVKKYYQTKEACPLLDDPHFYSDVEFCPPFEQAREKTIVHITHFITKCMIKALSIMTIIQ